MNSRTDATAELKGDQKLARKSDQATSLMRPRRSRGSSRCSSPGPAAPAQCALEPGVPGADPGLCATRIGYQSGGPGQPGSVRHHDRQGHRPAPICTRPGPSRAVAELRSQFLTRRTNRADLREAFCRSRRPGVRSIDELPARARIHAKALGGGGASRPRRVRRAVAALTERSATLVDEIEFRSAPMTA